MASPSEGSQTSSCGLKGPGPSYCCFSGRLILGGAACGIFSRRAGEVAVINSIHGDYSHNGRPLSRFEMRAHSISGRRELQETCGSSRIPTWCCAKPDALVEARESQIIACHFRCLLSIVYGLWAELREPMELSPCGLYPTNVLSISAPPPFSPSRSGADLSFSRSETPRALRRLHCG
jgi:hypothetical protein